MASSAKKEQTISIARKADGCLLEAAAAARTTSKCKIQRFIANVLGKRNEHQRGDRDAYITMMPGNLKVPVREECTRSVQTAFQRSPWFIFTASVHKVLKRAG